MRRGTSASLHADMLANDQQYRISNWTLALQGEPTIKRVQRPMITLASAESSHSAHLPSNKRSQRRSHPACPNLKKENPGREHWKIQRVVESAGRASGEFPSSAHGATFVVPHPPILHDAYSRRWIRTVLRTRHPPSACVRVRSLTLSVSICQLKQRVSCTYDAHCFFHSEVRYDCKIASK